MTSAYTGFQDGRQMETPISACRPASFVQMADGAPHRTEEDGTPTWIARGANFVVAVSAMRAGSTLIQRDVPDESMLLLSTAVPVTIHADGRTEEVDDEALVILPPGDARIEAGGNGLVVRIFSAAATAMTAEAANAAAFVGPIDDVAPLIYWPDPVGGFAMRIYHMRDHSEDVGFGRLFRSANLMVNIFEPAGSPRDPSRLSPHHHDDFEQGSLTMAGEFFHHLRTPWGADSRAWRPDETITCSDCSLVVIPPLMIHTTSWQTPQARLIDIFSPPRLDFSLKSQWIRNAGDYPMPELTGAA